jgi:hypothetical protein
VPPALLSPTAPLKRQHAWKNIIKQIAIIMNNRGVGNCEPIVGIFQSSSGESDGNSFELHVG